LDKTPLTPAVHFLRKNGACFISHFYSYERPGAKTAAIKLGVNASIMIKTLIFEDENGEPFIVLMHGDKDVSTKKLARELKTKYVTPCNRKDAQRYTGYLVGGISPFGTRRKMPVYIEETLFDNSKLYLNGGKRGFLIEISSKELEKLLKPIRVNVAR
jgi:Cys-tRNA(Pro) deacylase